MELAFWIVILFLLIYEPVIGYRDFQRFKSAVKNDERARIRYYHSSMTGLWIPALFILVLVFSSGLTAKNIGIALPQINTEPLGTILTYAVLGIALIYFAGLLYFVAGYRWSEKIRNQVSDAKKKQMETLDFADILPVTSEEKRWWNYVSITAGITEELIYRGFLLFALSYLFPDLPVWLNLVLASLLFGLAHTYQGWTGVLRTTLIGLFFSAICLGTGSILPLIALHTLIDFAAKLGVHEEQTVRK